MRYQMVYNERGERLWLPLLAGAAIISAPLWLNNNKCCNQGYYQQQYITPSYPSPYPYPYPLPYPYPNPYPYSYNVNTIR